jgi:hypothetical protein
LETRHNAHEEETNSNKIIYPLCNTSILSLSLCVCACVRACMCVCVSVGLGLDWIGTEPYYVWKTITSQCAYREKTIMSRIWYNKPDAETVIMVYMVYNMLWKV